MMNNEVYNNYLTGMTPDGIALNDAYPEFADMTPEELLLMQEVILEHIQNNNQNRATASGYGETSRGSLEPSHGAGLDLDEEFARGLELGDDFSSLSVDENADSAVDNTRSTLRDMPTRGENQNRRQDGIDPDRMTYEERQSLGESLGSVNRGLPADLISRLPTFTYPSKEKKCLICFDRFKHRAMVTTLPCAHQYHSHCITTWLRQSKLCPTCKQEVKEE